MPAALPERALTLTLARWLARHPNATSPDQSISALETRCAQLHDAGKAAELVSTLQTALLQCLASAKDTDARGAFAIFLELLVQWELLAAQAVGIAERVASAGLPPELANTIMLTLYSLAQQHGAPQLRYELLRKLVAFLATHGSLSQVLGPAEGRVARVERWVSEWELTTGQQEELWALLFDTHPDDACILYESARKYVALHEKADLEASHASRDRIIKALLVTIRSPDLVRLPMPAPALRQKGGCGRPGR